MIDYIYSSLKTFKNIDLRPGLNILLSDKSPGATDRQTRNRAGKTSLIEIVHFLCGANITGDSLFKSAALIQHAFEMKFTFGDTRVVVERVGQHSGTIFLKQIDGDMTQWPPIPLDLLGESVISNTDWKNILGKIMFGLQETELDEEEHPKKFGPTFRSLFGYFVRRQSAGGFLSPSRNSEQQRLFNQQVAISYLLGLDWTIPQQWEFIRDREKGFRELRKAAADGTLGSTIGTTAELRTMLTVAEGRYKELKDRVDKFQVLPEYRKFEQETAELTLQMNELADKNTLDREFITEQERILQEEALPSTNDLGRLYQEVGVVLPEIVLHRFEDVREFHEAVIQNRKSYLSGEIDAARQRIARREQDMQKLDERRSQIMTILKSHGALSQLTELQGELARKEAEIETVRQRFVAAEQLEGLKTELEIERQQLRRRLIQDYQEQDTVLRQAILAFEEISEALYEDAGSLTIDASLNGPEFNVQIHGARSKGISNMQIFCFDMMLMQICAQRRQGPGFLIHDSHLFDGVDERQVASALQVGAKTADKYGFQYIVTLNSDQLPAELRQRFDLEEYVLPVRLSDEVETGGLFGIRFN